MEISEVILSTRNIYCQLHQAGFNKYVSADSYNTWITCNFNIINFLDRIKAEYRPKFWNWLCKIGVKDINQIRKIYSILSLMYTKIGALPADLYPLYLKYNNVAKFLAGLGVYDTERVAKWTQDTFTEDEIRDATSMIFYQQKIIPQFENSKSRTGRPISVRPKVATALRMNNNNVPTITSNAPQKGVRSLEELRKSFSKF